jgi:hypothetical protein
MFRSWEGQMLKIMAIAASFVLATLGAPAQAQVVPLSAEQLVAGANLIARAEVVDTRAERVRTRDGVAIVTYVTFSIDRTLKGAPRRVMMLEMLGGRVENETFEVFGMPSFEIGDRAVLFLNTQANWISPVVGFMQGRFPIKPAADGTGDAVLRHDGSVLASLDQVGRIAPGIVSVLPARPMSLGAFEAGITALVDAEGVSR